MEEQRSLFELPTWRHYALCDPRLEGPEAVRYIGRVNIHGSIDKRVTKHLWDAFNGGHRLTRLYRSAWLRKLHSEGVRPLTVDLGMGGNSRETELIGYFESLGSTLTNLTKGGEGTVGARWSHTEDVKRKIGRAAQAAMTPEKLRKMLEAAKTPETRVIMSKAQQGAKKGGSSRFVGVFYSKRNRNWQVTVSLKAVGKTVYFGSYATEEAAAVIYDAVALHYYGPEARTNLIDLGVPEFERRRWARRTSERVALPD